MIYTRKFFDPAVAEPVAIESAGMNIAALMAKQGQMNNEAVGATQPITITEIKEEPKPVQEPTPAATATSTTPTVPASEPPANVEEPKEAHKVEIPQEQPNVQSWQEVLKSQQPDTVFKELGYDDKTVKVLGKLKNYDAKFIGLMSAYENGTLNDYVRELTTDYSKMTAEEVMRHQLRVDYPTASPQQLDALYKREVVKAYSLDSIDDDEKAEGELLLQARADKHRATLIANQQGYLVPKFTEPTVANEPDKEEIAAQQRAEDYIKQFNDNQYTKDIFTNKTLSIGEGDEKFTYKVDPNAIKNILYNGQRWMEKTSIVTDNPDGSKTFTPNTKLQFLIGAIAEYGEDFLVEYAKHFKSLGGKSVVNTIDNASPSDQSKPSPAEKAPATVAEAMARQGRVNYGGGTQ